MLHSAFQGPKIILKFEGDHNTFRPSSTTLTVAEYLFSKIRGDKLSSKLHSSPTVKSRSPNFIKQPQG